jgi:hypothetical protein
MDMKTLLELNNFYVDKLEPSDFRKIFLLNSQIKKMEGPVKKRVHEHIKQ